MRIESDGHSRGNPRLYELIEHAPKTGKSPTVWAWPELIDYLKIAGQPVPGPWPPHQQPRPDPEEDSLPVAVADTGPYAPRRSVFAEPAAREEEAAGVEEVVVAEEIIVADNGVVVAEEIVVVAEEPARADEAAAEEAAWRHPESSLRDHPHGH